MESLKLSPNVAANVANPYIKTINKAIIPRGLFVNPNAEVWKSLNFVFISSFWLI